MSSNKYLPFRSRSADTASIRLFCFPYAGGGASIYRHWIDGFPPAIDVNPVQLPGRENLFAEPLVADWEELVADLVEGLADSLDRPFVLFGHSMGALLASEIAARLERSAKPPPSLLVLAARSGDPRHSTWSGSASPPHTLDDDKLLRLTVRLGGAPAELFEHEEFHDILLAPLRNDHELCAGYVPSFKKLSTPILALGGRDDSMVPVEGIRSWECRTSAGFHYRMLPGGHFFLHQQMRAIAAEISGHPLLARPRADGDGDGPATDRPDQKQHNRQG
ncbi:surfactin synthase thioesterase subunit [Spinactinospora alkalitolerans]|uniref:Surfactin synthase thioesterase subunit n=1 Tax=Spinactinospora alkalitolerans TaxID=687207 RepID=A0A852TVP9_9ACTN|nr:alpha/beta fold hydrolase [Spinactinospora alkalitolerans]NYE48008.1 surfactin synthase thioesterase subunit [Spinactinospora alkalitolerans]